MGERTEGGFTSNENKMGRAASMGGFYDPLAFNATTPSHSTCLGITSSTREYRAIDKKSGMYQYSRHKNRPHKNHRADE
jgi:hypothetical protein